MTIDALIQVYESLHAAAKDDGMTLNGEKTYASFIKKLRLVELSTPPTDEAWTTAKVGKKLSLTSETVAKYCAAGEFPGAFRTTGATGQWRIPPADVRQYLDSRKGADPSESTSGTDPIDDLDQFLEN